MAANTQTGGYRWATWGDLDAFWGLALDNVTNLVLFTSILNGIFGYPLEMIFFKMIPGTCLGVMVGDLIYTWMAFQLAKKTGRTDVTAMPLGLDAPSTIGMAFAVLGPAYLATGKNAELTWQIGMAVMVFIGITKVFFSFIGEWVQRTVPQAGLLGSLAGIGAALLALLPLIDLFKMPIVGMVSLGIILYTVVAKYKLPGRLPGIFTAVLLGTIIYYVMGSFGMLGLETFKTPALTLRLAWPIPTLGFIHGLKDALPFLPIALPFGILTVVGGINVTESARVAGDDYNTRGILLTEAVATLIAGLTGGVAQSTPYIGQPAYKAMGARAAYTLATGLFIGFGGMLGYTSFFVDLIPAPAAAGILIFVGLDIIEQSFIVVPHSHFPAVALAMLPSIADVVKIQLDNFRGQFMGLLNATPGVAEALKANPLHLPHQLESSLTVIMVLGHGFILTGMMWGAFLAFLVDRQLNKAIITLLATAGMTLFGVIHSTAPNGSIYLPWALPEGAHPSLGFYITAAYLALAGFFALMKLMGADDQAIAETAADEPAAFPGVWGTGPLKEHTGKLRPQSDK
jgi:AGZA family xanthine/uracil permease-like MFS transporter